MIRVVSWNLKQKPILDEADGDVLLLQECPASAREAPGWTVYPSEGPWTTGSAQWRTAIAVRDAAGLQVSEVPLAGLHDPDEGAIGVSRSGSISAVTVTQGGGSPVTVVSVYARWESSSGVIYADANAHRILSDLAVLLTDPNSTPDLIVAGDWNLLYGYNEGGWPAYWKHRYDTVFARAAALGLTYLGPQSPHGRQADPWPIELPFDSLCVPTFHSNRQSPATATRQLDHVFATPSVAGRLAVSALNQISDWGGSDHCRILIELT